MPAEKTQPFCPCSGVLNWTGKGLRNTVLQIFIFRVIRQLLYACCMLYVYTGCMKVDL